MLAIIYWIVVLFYALGGGFAYWPRAAGQYYIGGHVLAVILFIIIGLKAFPVPL